MKEKVKNFFIGLFDTVVRFFNSVVAVIEKLLETLKTLAGEPKNFLWIIFGGILVWDIANVGTFGVIGYLVNLAMTVFDKIALVVKEGNWQLLVALVLVWLIVDKFKK